MRHLSVIILAWVCSLAAFAQDAPKAEIFAGYSYGNYELFSASSNTLNFSLGGTATASTLSNPPNARLGLSGWNAAAAASMNRWFSFATDFSGYYSGSSASITATEMLTPCPLCPTQTITTVNTTARPKVHNFLFGPQFSYRTGKIRPFAQFLIGGEHANATRLVRVASSIGFVPASSIVESAHISETGFAMAFGGGMDLSITHNLAWRLQSDYLTSQAGLAHNHVRVSTGILWRVGH